MSYDIRIWVSDEDAAGGDCEPEAVASGRSWQIVQNGLEKLDGEDIPESVLEALPGTIGMIELNLEPLGAPLWAYFKLQTVARRVAKAVHGVIEDPQTEELEIPRAVRRRIRKKPPIQ